MAAAPLLHPSPYSCTYRNNGDIDAHYHHRHPVVQTCVDVPAVPFPQEDKMPDAAADCWKAVVQAEGCAEDILRWLASPELPVRVSAPCCGVLQTVGNRCLHDFFPGSAFGKLYAPFVNHACGIHIVATPTGLQ